MPVHHPIAVIGAGLGGLTLALVLHRNGIDVPVYDLETSPAARRQGGMLDMHEESGQAAIRAAGVFEPFQAAVLPGGEATRILDKAAEILYQDSGRGGNRPEIDRGTLRDILLAALPEAAVRWGSKVVGTRSLGDGRHEVTLADGESFTTDLLIGADGAWSKVRPLVSDASPRYCGVSFVEMHLADADVRHPRSAAVVGNGSLFALDEEKGFLGHRGGNGELHVYAAVKAPLGWLDGIDFADTAAAKTRLLEAFDGWDDALRGLIVEADGVLVPRALYALPSGHDWAHAPGVTLLGDAAHLMSPFAGEGANLAMIDGADLAAAILENPAALDAAVAGYERLVFERSGEAAAESLANLEMAFAPHGGQTLTDLMSRFTRQ